MKKTLVEFLADKENMEKVAKALTPQEVAQKVERESTPEGGGKAAAIKGGVVGAVGGAIAARPKSKSQAARVAKTLYEAGKYGAITAALAGGAVYAKNKLMPPSEESKAKKVRKELEKQAQWTGGIDARTFPETKTESAYKPLVSNKKKNVRRVRSNPNSIGNRLANTEQADFFGGKVNVRKGSFLKKNVSEALVDGVKGLAKIFRK